MELSLFSRFPAEIIVHIFCSLHTFSDVFSFTATCQQSRQIWQNNVNTIYSHISCRTIQCRRSARILLANQGGAPVDSALTVPDVLQLLRNADIMKISVDQFNTSYVAQFFRETHPEHYKFFGGQPRPPYLTRTEQPRFINVMYKLWGLCILDPVARQERYKHLKLKDLISINDISDGHRKNYIFEERVMSLLQAQNGEKMFNQIFIESLPFIDRVVKQAHNCPEGWEYVCPGNGSYTGVDSLYDNCHDVFKNLVINGYEGIRLVPVEDLWDDTDDEDIWD